MNFISEATLLRYTPEQEHKIGYCAQVSRGRGYADSQHNDIGASEIDALKTLRFCIKSGHMSVLEFAHLLFRIECPIFVARQLMRYRNASYIERSLRYCPPNTKEWAYMIETPEQADTKFGDVILHEEYSRKLYDDLVCEGVKKEWARSVLPLSTETVFLMDVDLREILHIFDERLTPYCQPETRDVVQQMYYQTKDAFPTVIGEWDKLRKGADE